MTTKHTPGPWHLSAAKDCIWHQDHGRICTPPNHAQVWNWEPNARLIAAAPELLEALEKRAQADAAYAQLAMSDVDPDTHERLLQQIEDAEDAAKDAARAAIAKARGAQ